MKRMYAELYTLNNELIAEYRKRANNHAALLEALKQVNAMIQKAARLRGEAGGGCLGWLSYSRTYPLRSLTHDIRTHTCATTPQSVAPRCAW